MNIPFKSEFKDKMLSGQKTCTSRNKIYGKEGDTFEAFGVKFELTGIERHALLTVANQLFPQEGFDSPEEFINCWEKIHPRKGFIAPQLVWVHRFRKLSEDI